MRLVYFVKVNWYFRSGTSITDVLTKCRLAHPKFRHTGNFPATVPLTPLLKNVFSKYVYQPSIIDNSKPYHLATASSLRVFQKTKGGDRNRHIWHWIRPTSKWLFLHRFDSELWRRSGDQLKLIFSERKKFSVFFDSAFLYSIIRNLYFPAGSSCFSASFWTIFHSF